jgi:nucleoid-associated protein YgaU
MSNGIPTDPVQALLAQTSLQRSLFTSTSRYYGLSTQTRTAADGRTQIYLIRRFVPSPAQFQLLQEYTVKQNDRLDNIAARYLGDPEQFWRLADANGALRPQDLVAVVGRVLKITLPQGITGASV